MTADTGERGAEVIHLSKREGDGHEHTWGDDGACLFCDARHDPEAVARLTAAIERATQTGGPT